VSNSSWDEGVIQEFMKEPLTRIHVFETLSSHKLLFIHSESESHLGSEIAKEIGQILEWLGTSRQFSVILWWRDDPRELKSNEWVTRRQVNGGWTEAGSSYICIYRQEEWQRVVFHEMIHALEWDWKMPSKQLSCWGLSEKSQVVPALFEAWTELLAEWLVCVWMFDDYVWDAQRKWQEYQALQILVRARNKPDWNENTSVFAYYILKTALAPHFAFLFMHQNGDTEQERYNLLCSLVAPEIQRLQTLAQYIRPVNISLRMSIPSL
jgi:hypothetical protein